MLWGVTNLKPAGGCDGGGGGSGPRVFDTLSLYIVVSQFSRIKLFVESFDEEKSDL